jgi:hypothetical protein
MLFNLSSLALFLFVTAFLFGATAIGIVVGRAIHSRRDGLREPLTVVQAALVGLVALLLAFGLSMAVDRYQSRRGAVVSEANAISKTYLRAQTLAEPVRSASMELLEQYADQAIELGNTKPDSSAFKAASAASVALEQQLWTLAGDSLRNAPQDSAPRLYVEALNEMFDSHTTRVAALDNRVPGPVLWTQLLAAALGLGMLGMLLASHERGVLMALLATGLVTVIMLVIFDLDRPHRSLIKVPEAPLVETRAEMELPPAATGP